MNEKQIRLRSREEVQDFVQAASNCKDVYKRQAQTPTGGSSGEYCTMGETLMQRRRVSEEVFRYVKLYQQGRRNDGT